MERPSLSSMLGAKKVDSIFLFLFDIQISQFVRKLIPNFFLSLDIIYLIQKRAESGKITENIATGMKILYHNYRNAVSCNVKLFSFNI